MLARRTIRAAKRAKSADAGDVVVNLVAVDRQRNSTRPDAVGVGEDFVVEYVGRDAAGNVQAIGRAVAELEMNNEV